VSEEKELILMQGNNHLCRLHHMVRPILTELHVFRKQAATNFACEAAILRQMVMLTDLVGVLIYRHAYPD
jgi:hypothetical protein